jgi:phospholipase C
MRIRRFNNPSGKALALLLLICSAVAVDGLLLIMPPAYAATVGSTNPCVGNPAPAKWNHVVVLMFENHTYSQVIGATNTSGGLEAPYITSLVAKCGSDTNWHDANYKVDGTVDGNYASKPSYSVLTDGVSPSVSGLTDDTYTTTSSVDNIYHEANLAGNEAKDYYDGPSSTTPCAASNFIGAYHDAIRYYTDLGGQSSTASTYCNTHDKTLTDFWNDLNNGNLPAYSMILPTNCENMHSCTSVSDVIANGDTWASNFLPQFFDSTQYKSGDTALFFLWDEDTPIPNILAAPSITPGSTVPTPSGNPISHFSALRTAEEMLGLPLIGDSGQAPSLLSFFNGSNQSQPKTGDLNGDGVVNSTDVDILIGDWNTSNSAADLNKDGTVNIFDLSIVLSSFGG